jgi:hypothetical protein
MSAQTVCLLRAGCTQLLQHADFFLPPSSWGWSTTMLVPVPASFCKARMDACVTTITHTAADRRTTSQRVLGTLTTGPHVKQQCVIIQQHQRYDSKGIPHTMRAYV